MDLLNYAYAKAFSAHVNGRICKWRRKVHSLAIPSFSHRAFVPIYDSLAEISCPCNSKGARSFLCGPCGLTQTLRTDVPTVSETIDPALSPVWNLPWWESGRASWVELVGLRRSDSSAQK